MGCWEDQDKQPVPARVCERCVRNGCTHTAKHALPPTIGAYDINRVEQVVGEHLIEQGFVPVNGDPSKAILFPKPETFYRVIGWFAFDPLNTQQAPFCRVVHVMTNSRNYALDRGYDELKKVIIGPQQAQLLNWYAELETDLERVPASVRWPNGSPT